MLKNFRAYNASVEFYHLASVLKLPRHLKDQMDRAASSVSLHLAEGYGKTSYQEKRRYYTGALASLREVQAILQLARFSDTKVLSLADYLGAAIYKLVNWRP